MRFLNSLYHIAAISRGSDTVTVTIQLNPKHPVYRGHFPGNPITPGVMLLQIATELTEEIMQKTISLHKAANMKFNMPIGSSGTINFAFNKLEEENRLINASISISIEGIQHAKMSLQYTANPS